MTKRQALHVALAILSCEAPQDIVTSQLVANLHLAALRKKGRERIQAAAFDLGMEFHRRAGQAALNLVAPSCGEVEKTETE